MHTHSESAPPTEHDGVALLGASAIRVALLRLVVAHEELTALEIMDVLGLTRNGVGKHLNALTEAGFLVERRATHPRGSGDVIYWRADRHRIAAELWQYTYDTADEGQSEYQAAADAAVASGVGLWAACAGGER